LAEQRRKTVTRLPLTFAGIRFGSGACALRSAIT
jgi:hypothetical protein